MFPGESDFVRAILDAGWSRAHLRHPGAGIDDMRRLIESIPAEYHSRLWLHDHFELATDYHLGGLQLNGRNQWPPAGYGGKLSKSCHTIDEVKSPRPEAMANVTLSPIFDSVSKAGYRSAFTDDDLSRLTPADRVIALGGVTPERLPQLQQYNFDGFAVLGYLFAATDIKQLLNRLTKFQPYICYNS